MRQMRIKVTPLLMLSLASHVLGYGNYEATYTNVSKTLKAFLLRGYDKVTPPTSARPVSCTAQQARTFRLR